jgi:PadR family transcriptional regulator, regulatory protein AphA
MTPTSYIVLGLLERLDEASPYDLKREASRALGNFWSTPHSQIYRTAQQLADAGLLARRVETTPGGRNRTVYSLTEEGTAILATWRQQVPQDLPELRDPGLLQLYFGADPVPLARARAGAHRRQLAAYELRQRQDTGKEPRGPWLTLEAGIAHEREWIRFWTRLANQDESADPDSNDR